MNFGEALEKVKSGAKASREGWNGKEQYIELAKCISYVNSEGKVINPQHKSMGNNAIFPLAFTNEEQLLRTIIHEKSHVKQLKKYGKKYVQDNLNEMERTAYRFESLYYTIAKRRANL